MLSVLTALLTAAPGWAAVTITDCSSDAHCRLWNRQTLIDVPDDTVVLAGPITPLAGSEMIHVRAGTIVVDATASLSAGGKGRAILLEAATTAVVNGALTATNPNSKIVITAVDLVQVQGPMDVRSGDRMVFSCSGLGCRLHITNVHFNGSQILFDSQGDVIWDHNTIDLFGPSDQLKVRARRGSIGHSGALAVSVLESGRLAASATQKTDAVSEAAEFCPGCSPTPTRTPTPSPPTPTRTPTPTSPLMTATLPISTPSGPAPTPTVTPPCRNCVSGSSESEIILLASGDIDASGDKYVVSKRIILNAGLNINLSNAELNNDGGKCGEIMVDAVGQVNIQGATLIDDDCPARIMDVAEINGREQLPHEGFNNIVGTPSIDR